MNIAEAQRLIQQRDMLAAEMPPTLQFRESLTAHAETIVRCTSQLFAPGASKVEVVQERFGSERVTRTANPLVPVVDALKSAARDLRASCGAYGESTESRDAVLAGAQHVDECLTKFAAAVPAMATQYYTGPIHTALAQIRAQLTLAPKKAAKP